MAPKFFVFGNVALPEPDLVLPTELWVIILRKLDPKSLIQAVKAYPLWLNIARGDQMLRRTIRKQMKTEERARKEEINNPSLLVTITGNGLHKNGHSDNGTKSVHVRRVTALSAPELKKDFGLGGGPIRKPKRNRDRPTPYRTIRC